MDLDGLIISTQNRKGWDLLNPYLMLFWFHQKPSSNNALAYRSYFVNTFTMTNPRNLYVVLDLKEDWIWKNYGRALLSPGTLKSENHPIYHERNLPTTLTDKKLHYPFCDDLGDKEVYYLDSSFQPKWQLFTINHPNFVEFISNNLDGLFQGQQFIAKFYESPIKFPSNIYKVEKYDKWWTGLNKQDIMLLMLPEDFYEGNTFLGLGSKASSSFYEKSSIDYFKLASKDYTTETPTKIDPSLIKEITDNLTKYNHLIDHSSFQFCFNQDTLFSANLRYLNFKKEAEEWLIKYILKVKSTPAGTYYTFLSGNILWQLKLEIKQTVPSGKNLKNLLSAATAVVTITGAFLLAGALGLGGAGLADGAILNSISGDLSKIIQVNKLLQSAKSILPEENENISFSMGLFDFWSKLRKRPFWGKIYVSNNLKNNLTHNNNQNPITFPLNITFDKLWKVLKKGEYQGTLKLLGHDPGKYLSNKFKEGIIFFADREKDFVTPKLDLKRATNLMVYNLGNAGGYIGEEWKEEEVVEVDRPKGSNYHQRVHYLIEYEDGTKKHWLGLLPMFQDSELADGHAKGAFNLYFDKPVKYFWDVYTCIGCGAKGQFLDLHSGYDGDSDSWDTLYKDLPVEPWFGDVENTSSLKWCDRTMGAAVDVWAGRKEQRPNGKSFTAAYGFIPTGGVIRWRLGSTGVKIQEIPQHSDFDGLGWQPTATVAEDIRPTTTAFNFGESDIPDAPDIPEDEPDLRDTGTGEPETIIEPDITIELDVPEDEYEVPDIEVPDIEITPPEVDPNDTDNSADTGDTDNSPPDEFPDSGEGD